MRVFKTGATDSDPNEGARDWMIYRDDAVRIANACRAYAMEIRLHTLDEKLIGLELIRLENEAMHYDALAERAIGEYGLVEDELDQL
jgi:hypothetical protein